jgi:hypothetical protein
MYFTTTAGTGTTTIVCSTCSFTTWGITTSTVVQVFSTTSTTIRVFSTVSAINSATSLTISPAIASTASGDHFTFITTTQGIGRAAVAINGWDYGSGGSNAPVRVTAPTWVNAEVALKWITAGFIPMNGQLKNAALSTDCTIGNAATCDIGAIAVYPATAQVVM